jgi:hypothetical protein
MEKGIVCRIKAEIHRRAGRYQESVVLFKRSRELLGLAKDIEDLEIADKGFAKAVEQMKASR